MGRTDDLELSEIIGEIWPGSIFDQRVMVDGHYEICGEFDTVSVLAERPILKTNGPWSGRR